MDEKQQFRLKWNNYHVNIASSFDTLRLDEDFVDVTVACDGFQAKVHKVVLSACSPYFQQMLKSNPHPHPIVILRDVSGSHLAQLLDFMYHGEVNVAQDQLTEFLRVAKWLKVKGLADDREPVKNEEDGDVSPPLSPNPSPPALELAESPHPPSLQPPSSPPEIRRRRRSTHLPPPRVKREPSEPDFNDNEVPQGKQLWLPGDVEDLRVSVCHADETVGKENGLTDAAAAEALRRLGVELTPAIESEESEATATEDVVAGVPEKPGPSSAYENCQDPLRGRGPPRRASCPICGRWFLKGSHLREHVASIHYPVASRCELCGKILRSKASLRTHRIKYHRRSERASASGKPREAAVSVPSSATLL